MRQLIILALILTLSCSKRNNTEVAKEHITTDTSALKPLGADIIDEDSCVFNNDYLGLTTEWMQKLGITDYTWDDVNDRAVVVEGKDTVYLTQGGCTHFEFSVELKMLSDNHPLPDSAYWINRSLTLAEKYGFDFYVNSIKAGQVMLVQNEADAIWFEFNDDDPDDNLIYNGIEIRVDNGTRTIGLSQYFN